MAGFALLPGTHILPCAEYPEGHDPFFAIGIAGMLMVVLLDGWIMC